MSFAEVYPKDTIKLNVLPEGIISGTIRVKNLQKVRLSFKIKANNRNKYEVSPAQGFIPPESQVTVEIVLKETNFNVSFSI